MGDSDIKQIKKPIVTSKVKQSGKPESKVVHLHEQIERPEVLRGSTYKVKPGEHALYITINDIVLNEGTEHEVRRPFEIFINTKNIEHYQWVVALTRVISGVFRKGGDTRFLVEELHAIFDPKGGYWGKPSLGASKGKFYPSVINHIGDVLKYHLDMIDTNKMKALNTSIEVTTLASEEVQHSPDISTEQKGAQCGKCYQPTVYMQEGCMTCINCGDSKCG